MAKNIVKVNEEEIRGYMVGNIPDAIEKEDVIVVEVPAEETDKRPDKEKETASENPEPHPKRKSESGFRQKYLVNTTKAPLHWWTLPFALFRPPLSAFARHSF